MEETRFLYTVHPRKVIKNLSEVPVVRVNKSLQLTKEDVKICLKCGPVYRRFANEQKIERVTNSNLDRMHNSKYMTEEEYKKFLNEVDGSKIGTVVVPDPVPVVEEPAPVVEEPVPAPIVEEPIVEEPVVESIIEEPVPVVEEVKEEVIETVETEEVAEVEAVEEPAQEVTETVEVEKEEITDDSVEVVEESSDNFRNRNNNVYTGKKKHH